MNQLFNRVLSFLRGDDKPADCPFCNKRNSVTRYEAVRGYDCGCHVQLAEELGLDY